MDSKALLNSIVKEFFRNALTINGNSVFGTARGKNSTTKQTLRNLPMATSIAITSMLKFLILANVILYTKNREERDLLNDTILKSCKQY
jgi:hypothetical protein